MIGRDQHGRPVRHEHYRLADSERDFWQRAAALEKTVEEHGDRLVDFLQRCLRRPADLTDPKDVAWFLASYARDARGRVEHAGAHIAMASVRKRGGDDAQTFSHKLAMCVSGKPHVSTDGFTPYKIAIPDAFGYDVNHGMIVKEYGSPSQSERRRYSPARIIGVRISQNLGTSEPGQVCTSHVERSNLTVRM